MNNLESFPLIDKFFRCSNDLLFIADKEWKFIKLNPEWEKILGYKISELKGKKFIEFIHPDDIKETIKVVENLAVKAEVIDFNNRYKHRNGEYRWLRWRLYSEEDIVFATAQDITESKKVEDDLRNKEAILHSTLDSMNDGLLIVTNEGKVIHYNNRFKEIFLIPEDILVKNDDKLFLESVKNQIINPDKFLKKVEDIYQGHEITKDIIDLKNGKIIERLSHPLQKESLINGRVWIFRDITEQRKTEEVIHQSEKKYRSLFENMTSGFALHEMLYDKQGNPSDFRYIEANPAFEKLTGVPADTIKGKTVKSIMPNIEDYWLQTYGHVAMTGKPYSYMNYASDLGKYYDTYIFSPEKNKFAVVFNDVTGRIEKEDRLKLFKASIDHASEEIYWLNKTGAIEYVNEKTCENLGYSKEELLKLTIFDVDPTFSKKNWDKLWKGFQNQKEKRTASYVFETTNQRKDGSIYPVEVHSIHLWLDNRELQIAHVHDISNQKHNEDILRQSEEKYRLLFENLTVGFTLQRVIFNEMGKAVDFTFEEINPACEKYLNMPAAKVIGGRAKKLFPKTEDYWLEAYSEVIETGNPITYVNYSAELDKYIESYIFKIKKNYVATFFNDVTDRVKNAKILNKFKTSVDNSLDGVFWINEEGGFDYVNQQASKMLRYTHEELIQLKIFDIDPNTDKKVFKDIWNDLHKNKSFKSYTLESCHKRKDGSVFPIEVNSVFIWKDNNGFLISNIRDITERKEYEENLLKNQKLLNDSQRAGNIGSWEYYIETDELIWNDQVYDIYGMDKSVKLNYQVFIDLVYPEDRAYFEQKYQESLELGVFPEYEYRIVKPDETLCYLKTMGNIEFSENNKPYRTYGIVQDITEQKQYEKKILENQKLLNESQRIAKMGSWELILENFRIHWSDSMYLLHGLDKQTFNLTHDNFLQLVHPDDRQSIIKNIEKTHEAEKIDNDEYRIIRPDGEVRTILTSAEVIKNEDNQPVKLIGVVQDITESKIAKEALIESEERARLFVENTPLPIALFDTNMCYIIASKQWYLTYNVDEQNITGKYHYDLFPETSHRWRDLHQQAIQGNVIKSEKDKFIRQNGSFQWVRYELHPWHKGDKTVGGMVAFTEDITQKVEAAEALKETEQKMQRIFEFAPISIGLLDKRVILDVNSQVCNLTWYKKEELIGNKTEVVFPTKKEYEMVGEVMYKQLAEKGFGEFESKWERKDGKLINVYLTLTYLDPEDPAKGVLFTAMDITKQKEAEKQLINAKERAEESEFFLRESQRTGNIGSYKMYFNPGNWISTETLNNIFGINESYTKDTIGWLKLVHPDDRKMMDDYFRNEVIGKLQPFNKEYQIIRKTDNETRWVHGMGKLYLDDKGHLSHMLGTIQDITERKLIEEERKMMNIELEKRVIKRTDQLQQANKDLEAFAYSVSHDLRAPLRHIDGFMHLLEKTIGPADSKVQNYMDKIFYSAKNMSSMIDELLKFSRLGRADLKTRQVNLTTIINEIINRLKPDYTGRNMQWKINELPEVFGDQGLLEIAFENLISNAIKYTLKKDPAIIEIGQQKNCRTESVCIFIKDNGAGFDMAYKDKLFGVFQRLHKSEEFEGIGIGLANVKQIITKHGGTIEVESEINKGAIFYIILPIQKKHEQRRQNTICRR
ncbi:PAS domain S-box protein [Maribellus comscasis]|uniref:PAS domain S-box protein n=1 Tax=Maribellus comscasis TaxID=2681766 RepID=UPI00131E19A9|nr:PAS domain S-box protein [Maribellus comscasis]